MPYKGPQLNFKDSGMLCNITVKFGKNSIRRVLFHEPVTVVFWDDETKTVVKCSKNDEFDPHTGLAMAICKKAFGNTGVYNEVFKKWVPEPEEKAVDLDDMRNALYDFCRGRPCGTCKLFDFNCDFATMEGAEIQKVYKVVFGK